MSTSRLTPDDIVRLCEPDSPRISPSGHAMLYTMKSFREGERVQDIYFIDVQAQKRAITANHRSHHPEWSPQGDRLCFVEGPLSDGESVIRVVDEGLSDVQTMYVSGDVETVVWSPDGAYLAIEYLDNDCGGDSRVRVVSRLRHHFDSRSYIGDRRWRVAVADVVSGAIHPLGDAAYHHFSPTWSPDGKMLALSTTRSPNWDLEWVWDIYVVHLSSCSFEKVTDSSGVALYPVWSPDQSRIAFLHNHSSQTGSTSDYHLWEAERAGEGWRARCLSHDLDRGAASIHEPPEPGGGKPRYAPDGKSLFWVVNDGGSHRLVRTSRYGNTTLVAQDVGWPSFNADGTRFAALHFRPDAPPHVTMQELASQTSLIDTDENEWLTKREVCRNPRLLNVESGGLTVDAWLWQTAPEESRAPLLVQFHGGPHGAFGPYFSITQQILASHGYLVAALNYRGSAGYGQGFADLVHANWGPQEGEDGIRLIDALAQEGVADPRRVGVFGPSYGGFMTNWMVTHYPRRVQAGVAISTVSHLLTSALGIDYWESLATDQGGLPWEIPGYYHDHSPVMFADRVQAPLLLLHGEQDMTCPLIEAEMMFAALRIQRKPVEMVRYVGESHSFHRAGGLFAMVDAHKRMLEWFKKI